jgi:cystathionine beta-lyase
MEHRYDFTTRVNRESTGSLKWDKYAGKDILPMWVADMDFVSPPEVRSALAQRLEHGVFGYTIPYAEVEDAVIGYMQREHGVAVEREWLVWMPGLVPALNAACRGFGEAGDAVMTNTPVYPPFLSAPVWQEKTLQAVPLMVKDGRDTFDFAAMAAAASERTRMFILCNPHNPVGRVWDAQELAALVQFCKERELVLISDEIHCDLIWKQGARHRTALQLGDWAFDNSLTLMAPSKTYNVPGLACSFVVIPNRRLRTQFMHAARGMITEVNCMGYAGCAAAYRQGEPWRKELMQVLNENYRLLMHTLHERMPAIRMRPMEATYLAWLDVSELGLEHPDRFFEEHGVGLSNGALFGAPGYLRLNFGCPRDTLLEGLQRMALAYDKVMG